jgi:hypothetical protein
MSFNYHNLQVYNDKALLLGKLPNTKYVIYETYIKTDRDRPILNLVKEFGVIDAVRILIAYTNGLIPDTYGYQQMNRIVYKLAHNVPLDNLDRRLMLESVDDYIEAYVDITLIDNKHIETIPGIYKKGYITIKDDVIIDAQLEK